MESRNITQEERSCISHCIFEHWGHSDESADMDQRDAEYQNCLTDCQICG
jgi:hypothetical protein